MKDFLKQYDVVLRTLGPVYVGSGREINKKEYIFEGKTKAAIVDMAKLYDLAKKKGKEASLEDFLLENAKADLAGWLRSQRITDQDLKPAVKYELNCDAVMDTGKPLNLMECMKNPYGEPYIPGSSLKGMFRTILLGADIIQNPDRYNWEKQKLKTDIPNPDNLNRTRYLKSNIGDIEAKHYRTINRPETKPDDAVNDIMQGFIVSDSEPLSVNDLVLCQKVDRHTDGTEKPFPLLRECIKPGTDIHFAITVDESVCTYTDETIQKAVEAFARNYYKNFFKAFKGVGDMRVNYLYLGGGSGFVSKTVLYPLYGKEEGIPMAQTVFDKTNVPREHKHYKDKEYGASPHTIKCTRYRNTTLQMGLCQLVQIKQHIT